MLTFFRKAPTLGGKASSDWDGRYRADLNATKKQTYHTFKADSRSQLSIYYITV